MEFRAPSPGRRSLLLAGSGFILPSCRAERRGGYSDNGAALKNPGMGWMIYYYANSLKYYKRDIDSYSDEFISSLPGVTVIMLRLAWSFLQPRRGQYVWGYLDEPIRRFSKLGLRVAIRITCSENQSDQPYATPRWVYDDGAKYVRFDAGHPGKRNVVSGTNFEPRFDDPVFLLHLEEFVKGLAARYDGNPFVEFIDVGSFGVYGEGHTVSSSQEEYSQDVVIRHIEIYRAAFRKTRLIANHNFADAAPSVGRSMKAIQRAASLGLGLRDDSIMISGGRRAFYDSEMSDSFYRSAPIVLETGEYSSRVRRGLWDNGVLVRAVRAYRASYVGAYWHPREYFRENNAVIQEVSQFLGYRLRLIDQPVLMLSSEKSKPVVLRLSLENGGVAPVLIGVGARLNVLPSVSGAQSKFEFSLPASFQQIQPGVSAVGDVILGAIPFAQEKCSTFFLQFFDLETRVEIMLPHDEARSGLGVPVKVECL